MEQELGAIVHEIDSLPSVDTTEGLSRLQALSDQYFSAPDAARHLDVWFRLYERFPEDDGFGVFWTILHGIEAQRGYERFVIESIRRRPSHFPVLMANRLLNGNVRQVSGCDLLDLLRDVAADEQCLPSVRADAQLYLDYQRGRG